MAKYTVNDYAKMINKSVQSIYGKIRRNSIDFVIEDGVKYILVDDVAIKDDVERVVEDIKGIEENPLKPIVKLLKKENKKLNMLNNTLNEKLEKALNTIEGLNERLNNEKDKSIDLLMQYINETKKLIAPTVAKDDIVEVVPKKKKKKAKNK